jgi:hypothetical protein
MAAPIIPWEPSNIPSEIQEELKRRMTVRSFNYTSNNIASWDKNGNWNQYKGPMVSWVRICSNGAGRPDPISTTILKNVGGSSSPNAFNKERFVLRGGKNFYQTYGFQPTSTVASQQVIGYTPNGVPHTIEQRLSTGTSQTNAGNYPIHVPNPEVSRLEVTVQKELYRRAVFEWVCFSWKQLEYMAPYFLVPGITVMIEWGWNHYNPASLVNLSNVSNMKNLWNNSYPLYFDNVLLSKGNYDVVYGIVSNFNWSIEGSKIICSTEVVSKDRLYSGIAKNSSLKIRSSKAGADEPPEFLMNIRKFFDIATVNNLKSIVTSKDPLGEAKTLSVSETKVQQSTTTGQKPNASSSGGHGINNQSLVDIISNCIAKGDEITKIKLPYVYGMFWGRKKSDGNFYKVATPKASDFDRDGADLSDDKFWMNMGLVVEILNYFSNRPGVNNESMFKVDISNTIINAHPNLISCDSKVLIPNYQSPKYQYGLIGYKTNGGTNVQPPIPNQQALSFANATPGSPHQVSSFSNITINDQSAIQKASNPAEYGSQYPNARVVTKSAPSPDDTIGRVLYQFKAGSHTVYRNDLDVWINWYRYNIMMGTPSANVFKKEKPSFSFPFSKNMEITVTQPKQGTITAEKDYSGLLSNIYISLSAFKGVIEDSSITSYKEIYDKLLEILMVATDQFWDLAVTEAEGVMTIVDRKYTSVSNIKSQGGDLLWVFDFYDADSLIKSLRFRPQLSDAVATRTMYGEVNNEGAKFTSPDPNDILDFQFKDAIVLPEGDSFTGKSTDNLNTQNSTQNQLEIMLTPLQTIDKFGDEHLQMTVPSPKAGKDEVIKLIMPDQDLLRLILHDEDKKNNPIYCAIQPNITLELTLLGIGGLRTFQYFLIRNLPEPYSHRNVIFRIIDVHHSLEAGNWETVIKAGLIPVTDYIKDRVQPKDGWGF